MFALDSRLETSSIFLADLRLCQARLQADRRWAWIVLIPRLDDLRELEDLAAPDLDLVMREVLAAGRAARAIGDAVGRPVEKLNVGALGNVVPQLHIHVVGRRSDDPAWPGPVWGFGAPIGYAAEDAVAVVALARASLKA